ncbi:MAG: ABC transporter permease subunit, partial [Candidatus Nanopelagicales bacterium]
MFYQYLLRFRGPVAFAAKVILLLITNAVLVLLTTQALAVDQIAISVFLIIVIVLANYVYFAARFAQFKFLFPGMVMLIAFVVVPILYTLTMSTYEYRTGNYISKEQAIERLQIEGVEQTEAGISFDIKLGRDDSGELAMLITDYETGKFFLSTTGELTELSPDQVTLNDFEVAVTAPNFQRISSARLNTIDAELTETRFYFDGDAFIVAEGFDVGVVAQQVLSYDEANDQFINQYTGDTFIDNGNGNYALSGNPDEILEPGWRHPIFFEHYAKLITDDRVRGPFIAVFIWTVIFAALTVLTTFAVGLVLAIALDKPLFGKRIYRSILILPYAIPSLISILIWGGIFNKDYGAINQLLGLDIAWFEDANFARFAVIMVNLWLGFPYFYLVSSGALQAIPTELNEAAAIDGASGPQIFGKITLPLLLQILTPLLIASFAFNFNNFNLIYLLTGGGPRDESAGEIAGATDILISYTYSIAFGSYIQDLGLASAISVIIFVLVASISLYGIRRSK